MKVYPDDTKQTADFLLSLLILFLDKYTVNSGQAGLSVLVYFMFTW